MSKKTKIIFVGIIILIVGYFLMDKYKQSKKEAEKITKMEAEKNLSIEEIKKLIKSNEFKDQLDAEKQIYKIPEVERLQILQSLLNDENPNVRIIALRNLAKIKNEKSKELLKRLANEDSDEIVRLLASEKLKEMEEK